MSWKTIDCKYLFPRFAASFLLFEKGHSVFVENNTAHAIPLLLEQLKSLGGSPDKVDLLVVTHAHLDHAGGTAALAKACPNATILAHPKAARTLLDPSRLIESAKRVYGEEKFLNLYGSIEPIAPERIRTVEDEEEVKWGNRVFKFIYTLGHASHHLCMLDSTEKTIFTGDAFGVCYPDLLGATPFHFPSSSPVDFNASEAIKAIEKIRDSGAKTAFLTHFGLVGDLRERAEQLKRHIEFHQSLIEKADALGILDNEVEKFIFSNLNQYFESCLRERGIPWSKQARNLLELDISLNAAGLAYVCLKQRKHRS
jgi:glyoxylase-like metal-dependent hydrolase (beta-lactamase superfamily II)